MYSRPWRKRSSEYSGSMLASTSRTASVPGFSSSLLSLNEPPSMLTTCPPLSYGGRLYARMSSPSMRSGVMV
ncbi:hypothetical protein SFUMM280S_02613 [Streptomyces fumanus]